MAATSQEEATRRFIGNNLWSEDVRALLLHVLPQPTYHADAEIRGAPEALRRFGEALIEASTLGQGEETRIEMMASDGEGYSIVIRPMSDRQMDSGPLPYAQLGHSWDFERCFECPARQERADEGGPSPRTNG